MDATLTPGFDRGEYERLVAVFPPVKIGDNAALVHEVGSLARCVGVGENGGDWETLPWSERRYRS